MPHRHAAIAPRGMPGRECHGIFQGQSHAEDVELLKRSPREMMQLLDVEPREFLEEALPRRAVDRWGDLYLQLCEQTSGRPAREPLQSLGGAKPSGRPWGDRARMKVLDSWTRKAPQQSSKKLLRHQPLGMQPVDPKPFLDSGGPDTGRQIGDASDAACCLLAG
eukprot:Skav234342  [mRNA]  locus=scaffold306:688340:691344:+ [translate_table: standard]